MKINIKLDLPIKAIPINDKYQLPQSQHEVKDIHMGQSNTTILLEGFDNQSFNSVDFKFVLRNKEIDIYKSGLLSPHGFLRMQGISYKGDSEHE